MTSVKLLKTLLQVYTGSPHISKNYFTQINYFN